MAPEVADGPITSTPATAELARLLGAGVGTTADSIWCVRLETCHGTMGALVRVSEPWVKGDSAVILYTIEQRAPADPKAVQYVRGWFWQLFFLKRVEGEWRVVGRAQPALGRISPVLRMNG